MREIKFRVWDKEMKIMWEENNPFYIGTDGTMPEYDGFKTLDTSINQIDNYVLMQYTGIKDKNGKEIYDGDVLYKPAQRIFKGYKLHRPVKDVEFKKHIVEWKRVNKFGLYGWSFGESSLKKDMWEVIGNIYEDPQLSDKK